MASAALASSIFRLYVQSPSGSRILVAQGVTEYWGPGGSPDAVIANTPEKWAYLPRTGPFLTTGWKIIPVVVIKTADGLDVSDGAWQVPVTIKGVGMRHLSVTDLGGVDLAAATTINVEHDLGTGYTVPTGQVCQVGGGPIWMSAENDT